MTLVTLIPRASKGQSVVAAPLAPGDAIRLVFWREPDMNGQYAIDEDGMVVLPLIGSREVTTIAPGELKAQLVEAYRKELSDPGDVQIVLLRRVRVLGAVKDPGLYHVDATMTLGDAVALAGGATSNGKLNGIRVLRDGSEVRSNLDQSALLVEELRSGDQILVPERSWFSRYGAVIIAAGITAVTYALVWVR